ncbi:hypothetical protein ACFQZZ_06545 [Nocardia sp. GCM10030253]|uniref:hypothetical protein n=1 Tax=Nocardia sp. GCM10030253 TaxID=3273404 RepID=UPI003640EEAC
MSGDLPTGFDTFLAADLVHYWTSEQNRSLLRRIRDGARPGAWLLVADFWTDPTHTEPVAATRPYRPRTILRSFSTRRWISRSTPWLVGA